MSNLGMVDIHVYQQRKTLAQGMMDLGLMIQNSHQLRYVIEKGQSHPYYNPILVMICLSLLLQIAVGIGLIMNSRYNIKDDNDLHKANRINNWTVLGIFFFTFINVFISAFTVTNKHASSSDEIHKESTTVEQDAVT